MKLVWGDRVIVFEIDMSQEIDSLTGEEFYRAHFLSFGYSASAKLYDGIDSYRFSSAWERERAQMLAVEALLTFGGYYDGDRRPEGYNRVDFMGCTFTRKDFEPPAWRAYLRRCRKRWNLYWRLRMGTLKV